MPTSDQQPNRAYVWTWLPDASEPVVAGAVERNGGLHRFFYANSYLQRPDAISLYGPEVPLRSGWIDPAPGLTLAGCLRDGAPDAWGRRVIEARLGVPEESLPELGYMLASGTNRFGANDFQASPTDYVPRVDHTSLDELHEAADRLQKGQPLSPAMAAALIHGTSIGGARPKVLVTDTDGVEWIGKLSASSDTVFSVINAEATALELARRAGLTASESTMSTSLGRDVLLVRRFDRGADGTRRHVVSGLTMAALDEMAARYVTYPAIMEVIREHGSTPSADGRELFSRIGFNIAVGNSDDHARNHAAFWNGEALELTPAYDLAPGNRSGETSYQAMAFDYDGRVRESNFAALLSQARVYGLSEKDGRGIIDGIVESIHDNWDEAADVGRLSAADKALLWGRQILNPFAFYGLADAGSQTGHARSPNTGQTRQPRGVPSGGQFTSRRRDEADVNLDDGHS